MKLTKPWKLILLVVLIVEIPIYSFLVWEWTKLHGFWGGIWHWLTNGANDPIYLTAEIDFLTVIFLVGALVLKDWLKNGRKINFVFCLWLFLFLFLPSIGLISYLLFLQKPGKAQETSDF